MEKCEVLLSVASEDKLYCTDKFNILKIWNTWKIMWLQINTCTAQTLVSVR